MYSGRVGRRKTNILAYSILKPFDTVLLREIRPPAPVTRRVIVFNEPEHLYEHSFLLTNDPSPPPLGSTIAVHGFRSEISLVIRLGYTCDVHWRAVYKTMFIPIRSGSFPPRLSKSAYNGAGTQPKRGTTITGYPRFDGFGANHLRPVWVTRTTTTAAYVRRVGIVLIFSPRRNTR